MYTLLPKDEKVRRGKEDEEKKRIELCTTFKRKEKGFLVCSE